MIKSFKEFVNESFSEEELRNAERDAAYIEDKNLDADTNEYPDVEDDWAEEEEEEEE